MKSKCLTFLVMFNWETANAYFPATNSLTLYVSVSVIDSMRSENAEWALNI